MTHFGSNINNISTDMIANIGLMSSMWPHSGNAFAFSQRYYSFNVIFVDWQKCEFSLNIPRDLSHLCLGVPH